MGELWTAEIEVEGDGQHGECYYRQLIGIFDRRADAKAALVATIAGDVDEDYWRDELDQSSVAEYYVQATHNGSPVTYLIARLFEPNKIYRDWFEQLKKRAALGGRESERG